MTRPPCNSTSSALQFHLARPAAAGPSDSSLAAYFPPAGIPHFWRTWASMGSMTSRWWRA
jgi:hypothetical protein